MFDDAVFDETVLTRGPYGPHSMTFPRPVLMRMYARAMVLASATSVLVAAATAAPIAAQAAPAASGAVLSLTEALALARRNNPSLQNSVNARRTAASSMPSGTLMGLSCGSRSALAVRNSSPAAVIPAARAS